jgi:Ca2+-binding EF-hand superfamily protein
MRVILLVSIIALATSGCALGAARAVAQARQPDPGQMLERADANGDGAVTREEFTQARAKLFERLDRNEDGFWTKDDTPRLVARRGRGERIGQALIALDKDGDGKVSREEFVNTPGLMFARADRNGDGTVDAQEMAAFRAAVAERRK